MNSPQANLFPYFDSENQNLEMKSCSRGRLPEEIWKTVSAFANTEGGEIILGVNPKQEPVGLSADDLDKLQRDILSLCQSSFNYPIVPDIRMVGQVIIVTIPAAPAAVRPIYLTRKGVHNGAYIRVGSSNVLINDEVRNRLYVAARGGAESIEFSGYDYVDYLDLSLVDQYVKLVNSKRNNVYDTLSVKEILIKLRAIKPSGDITLFGLLAFGKDETPQEISAPTTNIAVTHYPGVTKVMEEDPYRTHLDNREFNGNIIQQFYSAFEFIKSKLPISGSVDPSGKRRDYLVIPEIALREALANSIAHRDYSTYSSRVQVDIYSDRLEIINPGTSLVPISELESAASVSRNPLIMSFLKDYGITEQRARGIRTIRQSLRTAGLLEPEFDNVGASFKATLYSSAFISRSDQRWLGKFKDHRLNQRQLTALTHLKNSPGGLNNSEYRDINNMNSVGDDKRATNELAKLVTLGLIVSTGERKTRRYYISSKYVES